MPDARASRKRQISGRPIPGRHGSGLRSKSTGPAKPVATMVVDLLSARRNTTPTRQRRRLPVAIMKFTGSR
jgi:hypothetical protein